MPKIISLPFNDVDTTEEQIKNSLAILNLFLVKFSTLHGFGGECWTAACAINEVLFNGQGQVVAALNKALYLKANQSVGHCVVHYLTDDVGSDFFDMQGFKEESDVSSWGMLASDDSDYIELFHEYDIPITDRSFEDVIWVKYSKNELEQMINPALKKQYIDGLTECFNIINISDTKSSIKNKQKKIH